MPLLCNSHFYDSDILKGCNILGVFHPVKYWRSSAGSNPKHHLEVGVEQPKAKKKLCKMLLIVPNVTCRWTLETETSWTGKMTTSV
ncbi:hypothetical protein OUZ56_003279 [Daphnia magna]|uniref:Uncharacterized protein n=1 Tax=Daphnia magna TaxID=35525 RepID=A0ABR0A894_9CRUS|nr:hypothetical protein OUZ56_003279 [Daphnia magna]